MKKIIVIVASVSILLQSCYSYKVIDSNFESKNVGTFYKIKIDSKQYKGKLISFNDSISKIKAGENEINIKTSDIEKIKQRKFSVLKTVALSTSMLLVTIVGLFIVTYNGPEMGNNLNSPN